MTELLELLKQIEDLKGYYLEGRDCDSPLYQHGAIDALTAVKDWIDKWVERSRGH